MPGGHDLQDESDIQASRYVPGAQGLQELGFRVSRRAVPAGQRATASAVIEMRAISDRRVGIESMAVE